MSTMLGRETDDHLEIIRHHCEHGHLCRTTESESTTLQYVFPEGNIATMHNQVANEP